MNFIVQFYDKDGNVLNRVVTDCANISEAINKFREEHGDEDADRITMVQPTTISI